LGKGPGYEVSWTVPTYSSAPLPTYEVRRSTTSLKSAGFSTGLCNNGTTSCTLGNGDIVTPQNTTAIWASSDTESTQPAEQYIGIRPTIAVIGTTGSGVSPILIYTHDATDMAVGDHVAVAGIGGNTAANQPHATIEVVNPERHFYRWDSLGNSITSITNTNPVVIGTQNPHGLTTGTLVRIDQMAGDLPGYYTVTVIDDTHLSLDGKASTTSTGWGKLHGPGELVQIVASGGMCVATTASPHGLQVGQPIAVSDTGDANLNLVDGAKITAADATNFTFACARAADGTYNTEPASAAPGYYQRQYVSIRAYSSVGIGGTGNRAYTSGGTLVSTEDFKNFYEVELAPFTPGTALPPKRLGGPPVRHGAVVYYHAPDAAPCSAWALDTNGNLASFADAGGIRSRALAFSGLAPATSYQVSVNCAAGIAAAGRFATAADGPDEARTVSTSGGRPAAAAAADNLVARFGATPAAADGSASAACAGPRCSVSFSTSSNAILWVRRSWCKNRDQDPGCLAPGNELARSTAEPVGVR
jgi:hypothetical protein